MGKTSKSHGGEQCQRVCVRVLKRVLFSKREPDITQLLPHRLPSHGKPADVTLHDRGWIPSMQDDIVLPHIIYSLIIYT